MNDHKTRKIEEEWEDAVARAVEDSERKPVTEFERLQNAVGLEIQAGVKSGDWSGANTSCCSVSA